MANDKSNKNNEVGAPSNGMTTIFITSFFGFIARNILATEFLKLLRTRSAIRIVILTPEKKQERHEQEFGGENVIIEAVPLKKPSRLERVFTVIFHNLSDTNTWRIHRLINIRRDKKYLSAPVYWLLSKLGHLSLVRIFFRWLENYTLPADRFSNLFLKYQPDLVFTTDVFEPNDVDLMRETKRRHIPLIGMVRSWDNITSKGLNRVIPDELIVNSDSVKDEAIRYNDIRPERIHTIGIPHYDYYVTEKRMERGKLFRALNLNPQKKLIFFAPPADLYAGKDPITPKVLEVLSGIEAQIVIRMPLVGDVNLGRFQSEPNKIAIDIPGSAKDFVSADISREGDKHLADLIYHSEAVVVFASTLAIDAVAFNKPVVFVGFDATPRPYWDSLIRYYDYDHQRPLLELDGVRLAKTPGELQTCVSDYLVNPSLDAAGRKMIVRERCSRLDGKSGERLFELINRFL